MDLFTAIRQVCSTFSFCWPCPLCISSGCALGVSDRCFRALPSLFQNACLLKCMHILHLNCKFKMLLMYRHSSVWQLSPSFLHSLTACIYHFSISHLSPSFLLYLFLSLPFYFPTLSLFLTLSLLKKKVSGGFLFLCFHIGLTMWPWLAWILLCRLG